MNRQRYHDDDDDDGVPRTRGDEPKFPAPMRLGLERSPHSRG